MTHWRLIPPIAASGATQMAIDHWLLHQHQSGRHPPTLRFYTWEPVAISLGYHQRHYPEFWRDLVWQGKPIELVRRPTGGRAVLHQDDLTYMVVTSEVDGLRSPRAASSKRSQVYQALCQFLIQGWRSLGVNLHYGCPGRAYIDRPSCFSRATAADLVTEMGEKLIGSAQLRQGQSILQHGSIRLSRDTTLFQTVFNEAIAPVSLPFSLQGQTLIQTAIAALTQAAEDCFRSRFQVEPLTEREWEQIRCFQMNWPLP